MKPETETDLKGQTDGAEWAAEANLLLTKPSCETGATTTQTADGTLEAVCPQASSNEDSVPEIMNAPAKIFSAYPCAPGLNIHPMNNFFLAPSVNLFVRSIRRAKCH